MTQIDKEQLEEINKLRNELSTTVAESGQLALQIRLLESDIDDLKTQLNEQSNKFRDLLNQEQTLIKRLSEKYGPGQINFETGEFTSEK